MSSGMVPLELSKDNNQYCKISVFMPNAGSINESVISVTNVGGDSFSVAVSMIRWNANKVFCKLINGTKISNINMYYTVDTERFCFYIKANWYAKIIVSRLGLVNTSKIESINAIPSGAIEVPISWRDKRYSTDLGELIGTATSNKSGLMSPKLYCAIPNSYVVNGATELKGKYVKIISVNDWNGSIINVKVSNYGNGSYFYIILCLATNNISRWVSGKLIAGNISGFSFYRVDKSIYMFIPDSIQDLYVTLDASMGNVSYGEEYENTIDLSNPITISWHNSLSTLDLGELIGTATANKNGLMSKIFAVTDIERGKGLIIDYKADSNGLYTSSSLIEIYVYSGANTAFYRVMSIPTGSKNIEIKYMGMHWCDFKYANSKLYVLPKSDDSSISYKVSLVRRTRPNFLTIDFSDFSNITGEIITPTPD